MLLVMLVLGVTGVLTGLPPATTAPGTGLPFSATHNANDLRVTLSTTPNQAGTNRSKRSCLMPLDSQSMPPGDADTKAPGHGDGRASGDPQTAGKGGMLRKGITSIWPGRWDGTVAVPGDIAKPTFQWTVGELPTHAPAFSPGLIALNAATPIAAMWIVWRSRWPHWFGKALWNGSACAIGDRRY